MGEPDKVLYYFADPMCSWCWGFSPVIDNLKKDFDNSLKIALVLGGLRPLNTIPMTAVEREEILHHWHEVQRRTGQEFRFHSALPEGFLYDTEPPSRAVVVMAELNPSSLFPYFKSIQSAFYTQGLDVTHEDILLELVTEFDADVFRFKQLFQSETAKKKTLAHFQMARQFGVRGFPTLILQEPAGYHLITHGYRDFDSIEPELATLLAA